MKYILFLVALFSFSVQADVFFEAEYGEQPDHLTPVDYPPDEYDRKIINKLFLTDGKLGRFISRPSFGVESCVSVYEYSPETEEIDGASRNTQNNGKKFFITVTRAADSIWHSMPQSNREEKDKQVEVIRTDREISLHLAVAIQRAWGRMLQQTKYPAKASLGLDGTTYQFSVWVKGLGDLNGETWTPDKGLPAEMVAIGNELAEFAENKAANEERLLRRLKEFEIKIPQA
ncbi:hypothetical protein [Ectopseudomonas alcaliphila]|uniref:Tle cognate immunity protein 4 C-terminal domain-containing protein n=1 Tax=Ectopseudomonas alcaliphila TaxID=101564 RepID=A0A1G7M9V7_9GAMM|nr:hypothetical protein [Pseudomonas alcaliphila]MDX5995015.1 hypothetical protein [Pseudomonas alcaliphila]SDF58501.1 hypothetical protein SAMN05216575_1094 [Pseudomonas alcaliphila]